MPQGRRDRETERGRDRERARRRDRGAKRCGRIFPTPLRPSAPPSLRLSVPLSLFLSLSMFLPLSVAGQTGSFEKQAISSAQEMSASALDEALPNRPFVSWFSEIIGPKAGVVWQLTECGEQIEAGKDLPACAEVNASLPGGRKVFVAISVGTFKKGL